ncbi:MULTISPECIES: CheF family chemotaxis protein [unclassified Methanoculleus]|uniref:CheF family chemotaxis protein n=1 Tax=unclassified Methanoculleus TaxID=2619537 RepID=UPI0025EC34C8|nr:CheF family chemotaxis protein [Methanoculleus sp. UBA377]MDD2472997.1 CheF family chemotaxis protein [Methanoculleus sp.]
MKSVPVKIEQEGKWVPTMMGIGEDRFRIDAPLNVEVLYKSVVDLEEKKNQVMVTAGVDGASVYRIASVEKVLSVLKKFVITQASAYRLNAFFMSPAIRGGVLIQDARWEKGAIAVMKTGIWFVSQETQVCIPLDEVTGIELTSREIQEKDLNVVKIDHLIENEVVTSFVLCPMTTLQVLYNFLKEATRDSEVNEELDPLTGQVAMLVYSGMDSSAIENMLKLSHKDLDAIYEHLLSIGLAEVLYIRKEIQLTAKGVRFISDTVKSPMNK